MNTIYSTRDEAIYNEITLPLGEHVADFDVDAIAAEVIAFHDAYDADQNVHHLDRQGYYCTVDAAEFWTIAAKHDHSEEPTA